MIKARLEWAQLRSKLQRMHRELGSAQVRVLTEAAHAAPEQLADKIRSNFYEVAGNASSTVAKKRSAVPLVDTEKYASSWQADVRGRGVESVLVMNPEGETERGFPLSSLAGVLEHGSAHIPARPHLRPFTEDLSVEVAERYLSEVLRVLGD